MSAPPDDIPETPEPRDAPTQEPRIDDILASGEETGVAVGDHDDGPAGRPDALDLPSANGLAARRRQTVFVLAGGVECGKTSAYAALYERLGRGPFAGRLFAGSQTIMGFEKRCHYWRESSKLPGWSMRHTQAEDLPWLHIRLRDLALEQQPQDLLLGDFDGEFFTALINNEMQPADLPFLRRADHVGVVLSGARIADPATRLSQSKDAQNLADQLFKDAVSAPPSVLLVVTMVDLIEEVDDVADRAQIERTINEVHDHIQSMAKHDVPVVRLAVRSESDRFPLGHGLEDLLRYSRCAARRQSHPRLRRRRAPARCRSFARERARRHAADGGPIGIRQDDVLGRFVPHAQRGFRGRALVAAHARGARVPANARAPLARP